MGYYIGRKILLNEMFRNINVVLIESPLIFFENIILVF